MLPYISEATKMADVLINVGIELKKGQSVFIEAPVESYEFVALLVHQAYANGASDVSVLWLSDAVDRERALNSGIDEDPYLQIAKNYAEKHAGYIRIMCPAFDSCTELSPAMANKLMTEKMLRRRLFREAGGGFTLTCLPTQDWADKVFSDLPAEERLDELWKLVIDLMKCNEDNPVALWREYIENTEKRKKALDSKGYIRYRYHSSRTDLTLSPAGEAKWFGGCNRYPDRVFIPNIPTEEIFSVPDRLSVEGHVESTLPLNYDGHIIEGIKLDFHEGKVVKASASKGEDVLLEILSTDDGARYLGEFAIVDQKSRIASSGRILYTTLYDENASCHIALGTAAGQMPQNRDEELGINRSAIHVDFMIGSDDMTLEAEKSNGEWDTILANGQWNTNLFC